MTPGRQLADVQSPRLGELAKRVCRQTISKRSASWWCAPFVIVLALGCSDPVDESQVCLPGNTAAPDSLIYVVDGPFPMHHEAPDWSSQNVIAYRDRGIVWVSPTGGFYGVDTTLAGLWTLDVATGEKRRLLPTGDLPDWSADGGKIAFVAGQIYTVDSNGGGRQQITYEGRNLFPSWKPDGKWIAYGFHETFSDRYVWEARADGSESRAIDVTIGWSTEPSWSPDGFRIAYVGRLFKIYTMSAQGTDPVQVTRGYLTDDLNPEYSPDGHWIAFGSQSEGLPQIWVVRSDGYCPRQLTARGGVHPSWSPDGRRIVFTRDNWRTNQPENGVLWCVDVITLEERQVTWKWPEQRPTQVDILLSVDRRSIGF